MAEVGLSIFGTHIFEHYLVARERLFPTGVGPASELVVVWRLEDRSVGLG